MVAAATVGEAARRARRRCASRPWAVGGARCARRGGRHGAATRGRGGRRRARRGRRVARRSARPSRQRRSPASSAGARCSCRLAHAASGRTSVPLRGIVDRVNVSVDLVNGSREGCADAGRAAGVAGRRRGRPGDGRRGLRESAADGEAVLATASVTGAAVLATVSRDGRRGLRDRLGDGRRGLRDRLGDGRRGLRHRLGDRRRGLRDRLGDRRRGLRDRLGDGRRGLRDRLGDGRRRLRDGVGDRARPSSRGLVAGAEVLATGSPSSATGADGLDAIGDGFVASSGRPVVTGWSRRPAPPRRRPVRPRR